MTDHKAPGGASSMTLPVDAFAYEVLHGARLSWRLFDEAMESATPVLLARYPDLAASVSRARDALASLFDTAEQTWFMEAKRAEAECTRTES